MDIEKTVKNLKARHFDVSVFDTGSEASEYLCREIGGAEVGIGGCKTAAILPFPAALQLPPAEIPGSKETRMVTL